MISAIMSEFAGAVMLGAIRTNDIPKDHVQ